MLSKLIHSEELFGQRQLSITHKLNSDHDAEFDVCKPGEAPPDDGVSRWWVVGAGEIPTKSCELDYVASEAAVGVLRFAIWHEFIEQILIDLGKGFVRRCIRSSAIQHGDPEDSPTEDTQDGDQVHKPLRRTELRIFYFASGLQDFMEGLDLPSLCIPVSQGRRI